MAIPAALLLSKYLLDTYLLENDGSSDEDDEIINIVGACVIRTKMKIKPVRITNYIENVVSSYNSTQFQQNFRISIEAYENLIRIVGPRLKRIGNIGRHQIDIDKQMMATIWILATPDSYRSVGERFDMGKSSLSICVMRVVKILNEIAPTMITWPRGERMDAVKQGFYNMAQIDNILGVVDGTFVPIKAPKEDPHSYITRKCNYAITLQGICDPDLQFTDVFVGYPGSVSDNRIFRNSVIYSQIEDNLREYFPNNEFIIGDKAYPVLRWCIPPYIERGHLTRAQRHFNLKLAQTRQTIERTFALLFGRFRRLKYLDMNRSDLIPATVLASCVLHNACLCYPDDLIDDYIREGMGFVVANDNEERIMENNMQEGRQRRDEICRTLFIQNH